MFVHHVRFTSISVLTSEASNIIQCAEPGDEPGDGTGTGNRGTDGKFPYSEISNHYEPNESCQTNIRKRPSVPKFRPQVPKFLLPGDVYLCVGTPKQCE